MENENVGLLNLLYIENNEVFLDSMSNRRLGGERNDSLIALSLGTSPIAH